MIDNIPNPLTKNDLEWIAERGYDPEEYREDNYFERPLVDAHAQEILDKGGSVSDVVAYVIKRISVVYSGYNDGCSCCAFNDLTTELEKLI